MWEWYADDAGVVRAGIGFLKNSWFMVYRKPGEEEFHRLGTARYHDDKAALDIVRLAKDSDNGFVLSNEKTGRYALYRFNFATQALGELIFESPTNDLDTYYLSRDGASDLAVAYSDDRNRMVWLEPTMKRYQQSLETKFPGRVVNIVSLNADQSRFIVWIGAAYDPGTMYVYVPAAGALAPIAVVNDKLDSAQLAPTKYTHYRARDGLDIPAYLTLPAGREAKDLPLIVLPHGGPYGVRDTLRLRSRGAVPGESRLCRAATQFPRLIQLRSGFF